MSLPTGSETTDAPAEIEEVEHQALDLLDALPCESSTQDAVPDEVAAAKVVVRGLLLRLGTAVGRTLIDAARELAQTEDRGSLEIGTLDEIRLTLAERPRLSLAIAPVTDTTGMILGLDREATGWAVLLELAEESTAEADERLHVCSTVLAERLQAAAPGSEPSRSLRVFRSAAVAQAGPSIRARVLAADHGEHLRLALALVDRHQHAAALVDAFDEARAALQVIAPERAPVPAVAQIDGPKRKFTRVHVILALIVLGLTLWHYVWR